MALVFSLCQRCEAASPVRFLTHPLRPLSRVFRRCIQLLQDVLGDVDQALMIIGEPPLRAHLERKIKRITRALNSGVVRTARPLRFQRATTSGGGKPPDSYTSALAAKIKDDRPALAVIRALLFALWPDLLSS